MNGIDVQELLTVLLQTGLLAAAPLTLAALGECFVEQAGLLNLGIEGIMLIGAFTAYWAADGSDSVLFGLAAGLLVGVGLGLLFAVLCVSLRADQVLVGLGITIAAGGLTGYLYRDMYGRQQSLDVRVDRLGMPWLKDIPVVGPALFDQTILVYLSWALVPVAAFVLLQTRFGLAVRAVGENPFAADASGISVPAIRYAALLLGGAGAGLGGAFLSVVELRFFTPGMTVGIGFFALAITMVGGWRPYRILAGAVVFGLLRSLETGLPIAGVDVRTEFLQMVPYLGIVVALWILARRAALPAALGLSYERGAR